MGGVRAVKAAVREVRETAGQGLSALRKTLKGLVISRGQDYGSIKLDRFWSLRKSEAVHQALLEDLPEGLPPEALRAISLVAEKVGRALAAALDGRLHDDSVVDIGGYLVNIAAIVKGVRPEDILAEL